jgi:hypothetical protein
VVITRFLDQHLLVRDGDGLTPADGARGTVR